MKTPLQILDRKIRIALVGCGRISSNHFDAIEKHKDNLDLVGICDVNHNALNEAVKKTSAKGYSSIAELLKDTNADIVTLCTPSGLHAEQGIQIANSDRHVITEKPMATRWHDGQQMVKACDKAGVRLFVVKQNRFNSTIRLLREAIEQNRFGRIFMTNINVFWTRPQSYYDQAKWRGTWEFDGGALMNQASHYIDLLDWLIGPVANVHAMTATLARNIEVEDTAILNLKWRSGTLGSVNVTMLTYPKNLEGSLTIIGEKGTVKIGGVAVNEIQHWEFEDDSSAKNLETLKNSYQTNSVYGFGHTPYYDNVVKVFHGEAEPSTDGRDGLRSLELLIAAYLSARDKKEISLPLEY